uniref:Uncharacterized protein n=1 Tax=Timema bartmani TaxID=61472 RepID=A0A7R9I5Y0_9NEOP|nr:unnamed protein product [Timema bartmani]
MGIVPLSRKIPRYQPGIEPGTSRSVARGSYHYTTRLPTTPQSSVCVAMAAMLNHGLSSYLETLVKWRVNIGGNPSHQEDWHGRPRWWRCLMAESINHRKVREGVWTEPHFGHHARPGSATFPRLDVAEPWAPLAPAGLKPEDSLGASTEK